MEASDDEFRTLEFRSEARLDPFADRRAARRRYFAMREKSPAARRLGGKRRSRKHGPEAHDLHDRQRARHCAGACSLAERRNLESFSELTETVSPFPSGEAVF